MLTFDDPSYRVYSHNEVMEVLQNKIASITIQIQLADNSKLLSKLSADRESKIN